MINMYHFMNDFSTAVTPMEEHTHKNEPAILYCDIEGAGKTLLVKWTDLQVGELCNPCHKICLKEDSGKRRGTDFNSNMMYRRDNSQCSHYYTTLLNFGQLFRLLSRTVI